MAAATPAPGGGSHRGCALGHSARPRRCGQWIIGQLGVLRNRRTFRLGGNAHVVQSARRVRRIYTPMTLFAWLCLAHLIGDWMLQNDWMARNKGRNPIGAACLVHCLIYTAALSAAYAAAVPAAAPAAAPAGGLAVFALLVFASHWAIDGWRLAERWGLLLRQSDGPPVRTVVDQTMHLAVLAAILMRG